MIHQTLFVFNSERSSASMNKSEIITQAQSSYQAYESSLYTLNEEQMLQPHTCGIWSVKDILAHETWYEHEMVEMIKTRALVGSNLWNMSLEERNNTINAENQESPFQDVLSEARRIHQEFIDSLHELSEDEFQEAGYFREMPDDWIPWQVIASNSFEHYPEHTEAIIRAFKA